MIKNIFAILLFCITLSGCASNQESKTCLAQEHLLDTDIIINIEESNNSSRACEQIFDRIKEIQHKMTLYSEGSEIYQLNDGAGVKKVSISPDTYYVLEQAVSFSKLTGGAFDPTIAPLVKLWGIGSGEEHIPTEEQIKENMLLVDYRGISLIEDDQTFTACLSRKGQAVDLGGIAKGYAGDEAKKILIENGVKRGILNLGGNIVAVGKKSDGSLWRLGIQNPLAPRGTYLGIVSVEDKAVVTSGGYERYFIADGKRYHHIINPRTGYPADGNLMSVTIIANEGLSADALSTGVYVLGLQKGIALIESLDGVDAIFVTRDKKVYITRGIENDFELTDGGFIYEKY